MDFIKIWTKINTAWLPGLHRLALLHKSIPQQCYLCFQPANAICCPVCAADMPRTQPLWSQTNQPDLLLNPKLKASLQHSGFQRLITPMQYQWPVNTLLQDFKYRRKDKLASLFSEWMIPSIEKAYNGQLPDILVPVPLHPFRQLRRYYNQAELLANALSFKLDIPVAHHLCKRIHYQQSQTQLTGKKRRQQLQHAFSVNHRLASTIPASAVKHIAVVDDVITTGATVNAVTNALKASYPKSQIDVWTMAISC